MKAPLASSPMTWLVQLGRDRGAAMTALIVTCWRN
jgi:hypothetical protein